MTVQEFATELGLNYFKVYRAAKKSGIKLGVGKGNYTALTEEDKEKIKDLLEKKPLQSKEK